ETPLRRNKSKAVLPSLVAAMTILSLLAAAMYATPESFSITQHQIDQLKASLATDVPLPATTISLIGDVQTNATAPDMPNSSRPPMLEAASYLKIMAAIDDWNPDPGYVAAPEGSPFLANANTRVLNLGQPNVVLAIGDSHLDYIRPRFVKLLQDTGDATAFPTMVFKPRH
ncbi:hypothetical protein As57867_007578, partial [Aphanomyces stellatus]